MQRAGGGGGEADPRRRASLCHERHPVSAGSSEQMATASQTPRSGSDNAGFSWGSNRLPRGFPSIHFSGSFSPLLRPFVPFLLLLIHPNSSSSPRPQPDHFFSGFQHETQQFGGVPWLPWCLSPIESTCSAEEDTGSIPWMGRFPGEGNGNPLHSSGLGNPMDRSLAEDSLWGLKESDTTEWLNSNNMLWDA